MDVAWQLLALVLAAAGALARLLEVFAGPGEEGSFVG